MPGFNNGVMWADNVRFDGTGYPGAVTTDGQLLIGSTASPNIRVGTLTAGTGISVTPGAGTISVAAAASVATSYDGDSGTATPSGNNLDIVGATATGGTATNIVTSGATNVMSIALKNSISQPIANAAGTEGVYSLGGLSFLHNYSSLGLNGWNTFAGSSCGNLSNTGRRNTGIGGDSFTALTSGESNTASGYKAAYYLKDGFYNCYYGDNAGYANISSTGNTAIGSGACYYGLVGYNTCVGYHSGFNLNNAGNTVAVGDYSCRGAFGLANGFYNVGIGSNTLENFTTGGENCAIGFTSQRLVTTGSNNDSLGSSSLDRLLTGSYNISLGYISGHSYTGAESSNVIIQNQGVVGESNTIRIGTQGAGNLQANRCFIAGITGVTVSNTALVTLDTTTGQLGTKTIANLPSWTVISADQSAVVGGGYFCNKVGLLSLSLPASSAVGDVIEVSNINTAVGTAITQGAGQQIYYGSLSTTLGAGGSLTSIAVGDSLKIVCRVANTFWQVVSSVGSWTVV